MARKYLVTEIQVWDTGAVSNPTYAYNDEASALAKYFSILACAFLRFVRQHAQAVRQGMLYTRFTGGE